MIGVAKAIILGTSGNEPQLAYTAKGTPVINISLAVNKLMGEGKKVTSWYKVVVFGKYAEVLQPMIKKGTQMYVEGELSIRQWEDKNGNKKESTEINAEKVSLVGGPRQQKDENPPYPGEW